MLRIIGLIGLVSLLAAAPATATTHLHRFDSLTDGCALGHILTSGSTAHVSGCDYPSVPGTPHLRCTIGNSHTTEMAEAHFVLFRVLGLTGGDIVRLQASIGAPDATGGCHAMVSGFWHDGVAPLDSYTGQAFADGCVTTAAFEVVETEYAVTSPAAVLLLAVACQAPPAAGASVSVDWIETEFPSHAWLETPDGRVDTEDLSWGSVKSLFR